MQKTIPRPSGKSAKIRKALKRIPLLFKKGRYEECKSIGAWIYQQGVRDTDFLHIYGLAMKSCGNPQEALAVIFAAHEQEPRNAEILNSLGLVFLDLQDIESAIDLFKRATSQDEKLYDAWLNMGKALRIQGRYNAAELALKCSSFLDRSKSEPLFELAFMLVDLRRYERAAEIMDGLLETHKNVATKVKLMRLQIAMELEDLNYVKGHLDQIKRKSLNQEEEIVLDSIGAQLHVLQDDFEKAIPILEEIAAKKGSHQFDHISHLGYCYGLAGRIDDGIATLKKLLETNPEHTRARYNLADLLFQKGDLVEGYKNYEVRTELAGFSSKQRIFKAPTWQGEPIQGKHILVWREQGIGDEIKFASLLPELHELGCSVTFLCSPKLVPLWERSFPWANIRSDEEEAYLEKTAEEGIDFQIPIGSLGAIFRRFVEDFHKKQKPWIARNHLAEAQVRKQLGIRSGELLVGVCWRSSIYRDVASRRKVFLSHKELAPLKDLSNVRWLNIQYDSDDDEVGEIRQLGLKLHHYTDLDQKNDLVGACNLIGACDLVISVSVSVMDLSGGIGVPMVLVGPEVSPLYLGTNHAPWFVNCRLYPIKAQRGEDTILRIINEWSEIAEWAESHKPKDRKGSNHIANKSALSRLDLEYQFLQLQ